MACEALPPKVIIIGFGSPIRGDDALGPIVADQLAEEISSPQIEVLSRHILTAELAEVIRDASLVIFIDAAAVGEVGTLERHVLEPDQSTVSGMAHSVDARGLLAWTHGLYGRAPQGILFSTRAATLDYAHCELSPAVAAMVQPLKDRVKAEARAHLEKLRG